MANYSDSIQGILPRKMPSEAGRCLLSLRQTLGEIDLVMTLDLELSHQGRRN
jgi:hypothetical protein